MTLGSIYCSCHFCFILCFFFRFWLLPEITFSFRWLCICIWVCICILQVLIIAWFHLHLPILLTWQLPNGGHLSLSFSVFAVNFLLTIYWLNGRMQSIWKLIEEEFVFQMKRDLFGMKWVPIQISFTTKPHICHFPLSFSSVKRVKCDKTDFAIKQCNSQKNWICYKHHKLYTFFIHITYFLHISHVENLSTRQSVMWRIHPHGHSSIMDNDLIW